MKLLARLLGVIILMSVFAGNVANAQDPVCDVTCTPDPTSSSYPGAVGARTMMQNARGNSSPIVATTKLNANAGILSSQTTVPGSQSYNYVIPILRMPGRAGMDLALNLYYNSRIWDMDAITGGATFNADRDFPSYGFRLDFGYVEYLPPDSDTGTGDVYTVTEGDGTKHAIVNNNAGGYSSIDGTYIFYNWATNVLTYKNGTTVQYAAFPSNAKLFRPVWVKDTNGNYFSIAYVSQHDQLISAISDSLGRVITFNYDGSNRLTSLTQALHPSGTKTHVTFQWGTKYGSGYTWYNFSGLTVNGTQALTRH